MVGETRGAASGWRPKSMGEGEGEGEGEVEIEGCDDGVPVLDAPADEEVFESDCERDEDARVWEGAAVVVVRGGVAGSEPSDEEDMDDDGVGEDGFGRDSRGEKATGSDSCYGWEVVWSSGL